MSYREINVKEHFGAKGDGVTDDTSAIQAALNTGNDVYIPSGRYLITSTLNFKSGVSRQSMFGNGASSLILVDITDGSAAVSFNGTQHPSLRDIRIWGADQVAPYSNFICFQTSNSQRWFLNNVECACAAKGVYLDNAWIGTAVNLFIQNCDIGLHATVANNTDISVHIENCGQAMILSNLASMTLSYMHEGSTGQTSSSTIDGVSALTINGCYIEYSGEVTVPEFVIGATTKCNSLIFNGVSVGWGTSTINVPVFDLDDIDGITIRGRIVSSAGIQTVRSTSSTKNIELYLTDSAKSNFHTAFSTSLSYGEVVNLFPNPNFDNGLPTFSGTGRSNPVLDSSVTLPWTSQSMRLDIDGDGTYSNAEVSIPIVTPLDQCLGKTIGVGAWFLAPSGANWTKGDPRCDIVLSSNGTGGTSTSTHNTEWIPGEWTFLYNELAIPSDATTLTLAWYANRSSNTGVVGDSVYVCGTNLWLGGLSVKNRIENGRCFRHPLTYTDAPYTKILSNSGSPENVIAANVGTIYLRTNGGSGTTLYVKESGTGNTGWVAK